MNDFLIIRMVVLISIFIYLGFDYWDGKQIKDEREELIRLKSLEFAHKATIATLAVLGFLYLFYPWIETLYVFLAMILASLYTEIAGKIYYRNKL